MMKSALSCCSGPAWLESFDSAAPRTGRGQVMKRFLAIAPLCLLGTAFTVPVAGQESVEEETIQTILQLMAEKIEERDLSALNSIFAADRTDLHIIEGENTYHRWLVYRNHLRKDFEDLRDIRFRMSGVEVELREGVAWSNFVTHLAADFPSGERRGIRGKGTAILEVIDGKWIVVHLHISPLLGHSSGDEIGSQGGQDFLRP